MKKLKRLLSLGFLAIMLGIPIYTLANQSEAATYTPVLKIRYLDAGRYTDTAYKAGGKEDPENTIVNESIKVQFKDRGVVDPYSGKTVKLTDTQYNSMVTNLKSLKSASDSDVQDPSDKVRYVVWYQFDKRRESTNYWKTEGYYIRPSAICPNRISKRG